METFEIHSHSFTIKWVNAPDNSVIRWELRPLKRSINLGIYRHIKHESHTAASSQSPRNHSTAELSNRSSSSVGGTADGSLPIKENLSVDEVNRVPRKLFGVIHETFFESSTKSDTALSSLPNNSTSSLNSNKDAPTRHRSESRASLSSNSGNSSSLEGKIDRHLIQEQWIGKCSGDEFISNAFHVTTGGLFAFVFDNTFSRTKAKKVMFSQWVEGDDPNVSIANSYTVTPVNSHRQDSASLHLRFQLPEEKQLGRNTYMIRLKGVPYLQGFLRKKRRRAGGNFVRRFFTLNFKYAVLDYYTDETSSNIRGNMLVTQTVISADPKLQMLYLDSGMEQWVLKALTREDFDIWVQAFNFIKKREKETKEKEREEETAAAAATAGAADSTTATAAAGATSVSSELSYEDAESGFLDAVSYSGERAMQKQRLQIEESLSSLEGLAKKIGDAAKERQTITVPPPQIRKRRSSTFWRRAERVESNDEIGPTDLNKSTSSLGSLDAGSEDLLTLIEQLQTRLGGLHSQYTSLLDSEKDVLISALRSSKRPLTRTTTAATSMLSQDFFDAQEVMEELNDKVMIVGEEEEGVEQPKKEEKSPFDENIFESSQLGTSTSSTSLLSEDEDTTNEFVESVNRLAVLKEEALPEVPRDLYPLPYSGRPFYRRDIPPSACDPPSLISIFRKSLGKDLTSITMPITSNEPLSFLQKYAESYEYADLLNKAYDSPSHGGERILKVACFAVSYLSSYRSNVRSLRKPFNPLLGETFEMVRPDLGIRLISEKVVHRPVIFAAQVDSQHWAISHCFCPQQKFYGKTAEITIDGKVLLQYDYGETYEWSQPTTVLKNVISLTGEKYTEPTATMTVHSNTGYKAVVTFVPDRSHFTSRRSEMVTIKAYGPGDRKLTRSVAGSWCGSLKFEDSGDTIWQVRPLVPDCEDKYGFTEFAAGLNDMTEIDKGCAPTDSRNRPDQKMYEEGDVEESEELKLDLEQRQRERRKDGDGNDVVHKPVFFEKKGDGELDWKIVNGEEGYWERRKRGDWDGLVKLW
ncbi:DEKNAAC103942 [Brettanomyces naardenensis]|uniref:DEKNAAC103942 n=1 Tax=Brettanomyces naardenensis TaxID=13370 RepID=A0A448YPJ0_BRENA|nr:DEKNAAC103942 [Brettanomyces naardenensis]